MGEIEIYFTLCCKFVICCMVKLKFFCVRGMFGNSEKRNECNR